MSDPFEQLRLPTEARRPRREFAQELRQRVVDALAAPVDVRPTADRSHTDHSPTDHSREQTMTDTTTSATPAAAPLGPAAIDFYRRAFGAVEQFRVVGDDGRLGHAEVAIGSIRLMLSDEYPEIGVSSPRTLGGSPVSLYLVVANCDAVHDAAVRAGAVSERPPEDQTHGNRMAVVLDPFGHRWMLSQPLEAFDLETYASRETGGFTVEPAEQPAAGPPAGATPATVWPCVNCMDARATIALLVETFGFEERLVVADEADPSVVHHSQLRWPDGGGVMLASANREGNEFSAMPTGAASCYVVSPSVDQLWQRALDAGLEVVAELRDEDYGSRGFSVRDGEGNIWSFGTYAGD